MTYFRAIQLDRRNFKSTQTIGNYVIRGEGSIFIEVYREKLEEVFYRLGLNNQFIHKVVLTDGHGNNQAIYTGRYTIQVVNKAVVQLEKIK